MGRNLSDATEDKNDKSSEKGVNNESDSDTDSDLDEEEFIVEKILKMRTTKKGKVQCKKFIIYFKIIVIEYFLFYYKRFT
jgi:hypothetical protein